MMKINKEIQFYSTSNSKQPVKEWLKDFKDEVTQTRIERRLEKLALGHFGDVKSVGDGILELRLHFGPGYRVYFSEVNNFIVLLLCGGDKSTQAKDIKKAKEYWHEFIKRTYV